jgi:hypothetical protein
MTYLPYAWADKYCKAQDLMPMKWSTPGTDVNIPPVRQLLIAIGVESSTLLAEARNMACIGTR